MLTGSLQMCRSRARSDRPHRLFLIVGSIVTMLGSTAGLLLAQTPVAPTPASHAPVVAKQDTAPGALPKIPNKPDIVTVIPFYWKPNETGAEQTKVIIPANIAGAHGNLILDTGVPDLALNRTFFQPNSTGGVDSVTAANSDESEEFAGERHVKLGLGTLVDTYSGNTTLDHGFGNFSWVFAPRLGNIGVAALKPFETIIDYTHQRLILIRLDSAGHRLVDVPAYRPMDSMPLLSSRIYPSLWSIEVRMSDVVDTLIVDTGTEITILGAATRKKIASHLVRMPKDPKYDDSLQSLDHALVGNRSLDKLTVTDSYDQFPDMVGYSFLSRFGVVGFNFRTRQMILYGPTPANP